MGWPWEHFCSLKGRVSVATRVSPPAGRLMSPRRGGAVRERARCHYRQWPEWEPLLLRDIQAVIQQELAGRAVLRTDLQ